MFLDLSKSQQGHSKVKNIPFQNNNKAQEYLTSPDFTNKLRALLFNLRCQTTVGLKDNFHNFYKNNLMCSMKCNTSTDSQSHILNCPKLLLHLNEKQKEDVRNVRYEYLFGNITEQLNITKVFKMLLHIRQRLLEEHQEPAYLGNNSGPNV